MYMHIKEQYNNTQTVFFLLDKNSNGFSNNEIRRIRNIFAKQFDKHKDFVFYDHNLNKPMIFANLLEENRGSYLILKDHDEIWLIEPKRIDMIITWLNSNPDDNSWTVILNSLKRLLPSQFDYEN